MDGIGSGNSRCCRRWCSGFGMCHLRDYAKTAQMGRLVSETSCFTEAAGQGRTSWRGILHAWLSSKVSPGLARLHSDACGSVSRKAVTLGWHLTNHLHVVLYCVQKHLRAVLGWGWLLPLEDATWWQNWTRSSDNKCDAGAELAAGHAAPQQNSGPWGLLGFILLLFWYVQLCMLSADPEKFYRS